MIKSAQFLKGEIKDSKVKAHLLCNFIISPFKHKRLWHSLKDCEDTVRNYHSKLLSNFPLFITKSHLLSMGRCLLHVPSSVFSLPTLFIREDVPCQNCTEKNRGRSPGFLNLIRICNLYFIMHTLSLNSLRVVHVWNLICTFTNWRRSFVYKRNNSVLMKDGRQTESLPSFNFSISSNCPTVNRTLLRTIFSTQPTVNHENCFCFTLNIVFHKKLRYKY